jgi:predicted ferric reductase
MDVLFNTLLLSQVGSVANFRNKYPILIFLSFLMLVFVFTYFFLGITQFSNGLFFKNPRKILSLNILDVLGLVLFAALLSYTLVYHTEVLLYTFIIIGILSLIFHSFLPNEYKIYYTDLLTFILFSFFILVWLSPPIYDLYMYYNNKQTPKTAAGQIPTQPQSAGSSRKRRK